MVAYGFTEATSCLLEAGAGKGRLPNYEGLGVGVSYCEGD